MMSHKIKHSSQNNNYFDNQKQQLDVAELSYQQSEKEKQQLKRQLQQLKRQLKRQLQESEKKNQEQDIRKQIKENKQKPKEKKRLQKPKEKKRLQKDKTISNVKSTKKKSQTHYFEVYMNKDHDNFKTNNFEAIKVGDCKVSREEKQQQKISFQGHIKRSGIDEVIESIIKGRSTTYHRAANETVINCGLLEKTAAQICGISLHKFSRIKKDKIKANFNSFVKDVINICYFYSIRCVVTLSNGKVVDNSSQEKATIFR